MKFDSTKTHKGKYLNKTSLLNKINNLISNIDLYCEENHPIRNLSSYDDLKCNNLKVKLQTKN